eukprot:SAG31_NODE_685_length_12832_cov_28.355376_3_plen_426_part_00
MSDTYSHDYHQIIGSCEQPQVTQIASLGSDNVDIVTGCGHWGIAVKANGEIWIWGWNAYGALGNGCPTGCTWTGEPYASWTSDDMPEPTLFAGLGTDVAQLALGNNHGFALKHDGTVFGWGCNSCGHDVYALGLGDEVREDDHYTPVQLASLGADNAMISAQGSGGTVMKEDGRIFNWGEGRSFQLGDGNGDQQHRARTPQHLMAAGTDNVFLTGNNRGNTMVLKRNGSVVVWGIESGVTGCYPQSECINHGRPTLVASLPLHPVRIQFASDTGVATYADGSIYAWGQLSANNKIPPEVNCAQLGCMEGCTCLTPVRLDWFGVVPGSTLNTASSGSTWFVVRPNGTAVSGGGGNCRGQLGGALGTNTCICHDDSLVRSTIDGSISCPKGEETDIAPTIGRTLPTLGDGILKITGGNDVAIMLKRA